MATYLELSWWNAEDDFLVEVEVDGGKYGPPPEPIYIGVLSVKHEETGVPRPDLVSVVSADEKFIERVMKALESKALEYDDNH